MLEREIEIRNASRADRSDQGIAEIARVQVEQTNPIDKSIDLLHERNDRSGAEFLWPVGSERREILSHQHDLAGASLRHLGQDRVDISTALRAAERRDGAEPT